MNIAQTLQAHIQALPAIFQSEVLDFVEYLEKKHGVGLAEKKADNAQTEAFIASMAHSLGDDFPDDISDVYFGKMAIRETLSLKLNND